jgi:hypothetical protein
MRRLLSLLFALVFVLSFAAPILAQPGGSTQPEHQELNRKKKKKKKKHPGELSPAAGNSDGSRSGSRISQMLS